MRRNHANRRCNRTRPGAAHWDRRVPKPEEGANIHACLASNEASYINGAVIGVAGGLTR
ncbi:SDR family oxidoreductase [Herbaspirillum lusitanum]|nr:SDR family oxidoreductase [Herbaspirillum lusitanum]